MYRYDVKSRCIGKKFPGAEWEEYIYDNSGCLIMSQDGNLRARGEWKVTIPDIFGRAAVSGFFNGEPDKNAIASSVVRATPDINSSYGYSVSLPLTDGMSVAEVLYYDNYDFLQLAGFSDGGLDFTSLAPYGDVYGDAGSRVLHKGLMTGRIVSVASGEGSACDAYYYDYRKRLVQSRRITPEGGQEVVRTKYTYIGEAIEELMTVMPRNGAKTDSLHTVRVYDRAGRLMSEAVELNGGLPAVTTYSYDAVGRVASVAAGLFGQVATTSFGYNTRNWMTGQNTVSAQGDTLFAADLRYNSGLVHPGSVPLYAGNISEWQWQNADGRTHTYSFSYDTSGRLTGSALFSESNADGSFTEGGIIYDRNGNIIGLTRTNGDDEFAKGFAYQGNMLKSLCGKDETSGEYLYDGNGNMTHDGHNGLDLEYNRINLMQKVTRNGAAIADYRYLYDGTKTNAMDSRGEGLEYHGPFTYGIGKDGSVSLLEARFAGGRFVRMRDTEGDIMEPVYTFTDHLGSVRAQASSGGDLMEHDNYLPFGTRWNDGSPTDPDNRYRFNGKEEQSFAGLPYIDYGARMYDPCTARWISQDPLAEKYCSVSPYAFCNNNPVNIIDPNGMDIWELDNMGNVVNRIEDKEKDAFHIVEKNADGEWKRTGKEISFEYGKFSNENDSFVTLDETSGAELFKFLSDNTLVENGMITTLDKAIIFSDHSVNSINLFKKAKQLEIAGGTVTKLIHSHPNNTIPSGYSSNLKNRGDKVVANILDKSNNYLVEHYVYSPKYGNLTQYDKEKIIGIIEYNLIFQSIGVH